MTAQCFSSCCYPPERVKQMDAKLERIEALMKITQDKGGNIVWLAELERVIPDEEEEPA